MSKQANTSSRTPNQQPLSLLQQINSLKQTIALQRDTILKQSSQNELLMSKLRQSETLRLQQQTKHQRLIAFLKQRNITIECSETTGETDREEENSAPCVSFAKHFSMVEESVPGVGGGKGKLPMLLSTKSLKNIVTDRVNPEGQLRTLRECKMAENGNKITVPTFKNRSMAGSAFLQKRQSYFDKIQCSSSK